MDIIRADLLKRKDKGSIELIDALLEKVYNFSDGKSALGFYYDVIMQDDDDDDEDPSDNDDLCDDDDDDDGDFFSLRNHHVYLLACMHIYLYICMHALCRPRPDQHHSDGEFGTTILLRRALLYGTNSRNSSRRRR